MAQALTLSRPLGGDQPHGGAAQAARGRAVARPSARDDRRWRARPGRARPRLATAVAHRARLGGAAGCASGPAALLIRNSRAAAGAPGQCGNSGRAGAQSGRRSVPFQGQCSGARPGAQMPCQRGLLRSREPGRRRRARGRAGGPQPRPPPGLPGDASAASSTKARPGRPAASSPSPATARSIASPTPTAGAAPTAGRRGGAAGSVYAPVGWATHYHADYVVPYWASTHGQECRRRGAHLSIAGRGGWGQPAAFTNGYAGREPNAAALRNAALAVPHVTPV